MEDGYTRGEGRMGERGSQVRVRSRLLRYLAAAVRAAGSHWMAMALDGPSAWGLLIAGGLPQSEEV